MAVLRLHAANCPLAAVSVCMNQVETPDPKFKLQGAGGGNELFDLVAAVAITDPGPGTCQGEKQRQGRIRGDDFPKSLSVDWMEKVKAGVQVDSEGMPWHSTWIWGIHGHDRLHPVGLIWAW